MNCKIAIRLLMHENVVLFFDLTKQGTSKIKISFTGRKNTTQTVNFEGVTDWWSILPEYLQLWIRFNNGWKCSQIRPWDKTVIASSWLQRMFTLAFLVNGQDTGTYICSSIPDMLCFVLSSLFVWGLFVHRISGNEYGYEKANPWQRITYAFM